MTASGSLRATPLGRLVADAARGRLTGALVLSHEDRRYALWFQEGLLVDAESPLPQDQLLRALLEAGLITREHAGEALRRVSQSPGKTPLTALVELGALQGDLVGRAATFGLVTRALRAFALPDATFTIEEVAPSRNEGGPIDPRWVIHRGVRKHYDEARLDRELAGLAGRAIKLPVEPAAIVDAFGFGDEERICLAYLQKGYWDPQDLVDACVHLARPVVLAVVYALHVTGTLDEQPANTVPRLRKRSREATQRISLEMAAAAPSAGAPLGMARTAAGTPAIGPAPGAAETSPAAGPTATAAPGRSSFIRSAPLTHESLFGDAQVTAPRTRPRMLPTTGDPTMIDSAAVDAAPGGAVPGGAVPGGAVPGGAVPAGAIPAGTVPAGAVSAGAVPGGAVPGGAVPAGAVPGGAVPAGAVLAGAVSSGAVSAGAVPAGAVSSGAVSAGAVPASGSSSAAAPVALGGPPTPTVADKPGTPRTRAAATSTTPEAISLRQEVQRKLAAIQAGADHFAVLEVDRNAPKDQVKAAYFRLAKTYHPDRLAVLGLEELRSDVERIFARLSDAFAVLSDDKRRKEYLDVLARGGETALKRQEDAEVARAQRILSAEEQFRIGEMALRRQLWAQALESFGKAVELNPDEAEHHALFGWALFCSTSDKNQVLAEAKKCLHKALELNRACAPAYFYLGQLAKHEGDNDRAYSYFQKALELRPGHLDAEREIRILDMRRGKGGDKKGGWFKRR